MEVGSFGDVVFEVSADRVFTPQSISRERKGSYAEHKVLGVLPRLEYLAPELATMNMQVRLLASMGVNPLQEADKLAKMSKEGKVAKLIILGVNCGDMVLESVTQQWRHSVAGSIHTIDLSLKFKEYV